MKTIQGLEDYSYQEVCDMVLDHINTALEDNGYSAEDLDIIEIQLHGSRLRGTARPDSDLDAVVEYSGDFREDDLFDLLNEDPLFIEDVQVDINPITGSMSSYMNKSNAYDKQKRIEAGLEARVRKLESLLFEAHKLDYTVISNVRPSDRPAHIEAGLNELKPGDKLLMTGERGSVAIITKLSDNDFNIMRSSSSYNLDNTDIVTAVCRSGNNLHEMPKAIKLVPNSSINYEDDVVLVYQGKKKFFTGTEDEDPMKRKDWRYIREAGLYYYVDYVNDGVTYYKIKKYSMSIEQYLDDLNSIDYNNLYDTYLLANTISLMTNKHSLNEMEFYFDYILSLSNSKTNIESCPIYDRLHEWTNSFSHQEW